MGALEEDESEQQQQQQQSDVPEEDADEDEEEAEESSEEATVTAASAQAKDDDHDELGAEKDVQLHLQDAVEGSLRLKRLLSEDCDSAQKRQRLDADTRTPIFRARMEGLLNKWDLVTDLLSRHVLLQCSSEELKELDMSSFSPDVSGVWKCPAELIAKRVVESREQKMCGGGPLDVVATFKFRWNMSAEIETQLRSLSHKSLRYVLEEYDGETPIEEVITAGNEVVPEAFVTRSAAANEPGVKAMSRFSRLEVIDPLADCAVFGDANLTFALRLAKHRKQLGHVGRVIATTFESLETLKERYQEIESSIKELEEHFAEVHHEVDCTRIGIDKRFAEMEESLGAVYYNFPHSGAIQGYYDGHPVVNWRHENLMRLFFRALRSFVKPGGSVKIASNMSAVGVRYSYIVGGATENEFVHEETVPFMEWHMHRYGRSYGDRRDAYKRPDAKKNESYNAQRGEKDMVYCFRYAPTGKTLGKQFVRLPPSLKVITSCADGPFADLQGQAKDNLANQLHKRFIMEVSGIHVG